MHRPHYAIRLLLSSYILSVKMVQCTLWVAVAAAYCIGAQNVLGTVHVTCNLLPIILARVHILLARVFNYTNTILVCVDVTYANYSK